MNRRINLYDLLFQLFIFLFPILPEFTIVGGRCIYEWTVVIQFIVLLITKNRFKDKKTAVGLFWGIVIYLIMYGIHGEFQSVIGIIINCFLVILLVYNGIDSTYKLEKSIYTLMWGSILVCIEAFVELLTEYNLFSLIQTIDATNPMGAIILGYRDGHVRVEGPFGQPLPFAMYLLFINFLCIFMLVKRKKENRKPRKIVYIAYVLSLLTIVFSTARMVLILAIVLQCVYVLSLRQDKKLIVIISGILGIGIVAATTPEVLQFIYLIPSVFNSSYYDKLVDGGQNIAYRLQLLTVLSKYVESKPLFGLGYAESQGLNFFIETPTASWTAYSIDNNYLSYLVKYGMVGLMANIYPLLWALRSSFQGMKKTDENVRDLFKWFFVIISLYAINLFTVFQMGEKRVFFIIVGMLLALLRIVSKHEDELLRR